MTQPQDSEPDARAALEHYGSALRHFFQRRIGDRRAEVDDLVQEVFVRLFNRRGREPIDNLTGYVFQIAANLLRERSRRLVRHSAAAAPYLSPGLLEGDEDFSAEHIHAARDAWEQIESCLRELPARVRTVFVLNRFEEMTGVEISRRLGVSVSTVEKDMIRAMLHIKERLR